MSKSDYTIVYRGSIFRVLQKKYHFPDGKIKVFEIAERSPGVRIIVISGTNLLLTREWRHEINGFDFRLPGGKIFDSLKDFEKNLSDMQVHAKLAAKRELLEETKIDLPANNFVLFQISKGGATVAWDLYYFAVENTQDDIKADAICTEEGEEISIDWYPLPTVAQYCIDGKISEDRTVSVLLKYLYSQGYVKIMKNMDGYYE